MAQKHQHVLIVSGPESSGKSTLAGQLAKCLGAPLVPEVARTYLETHGADYSPQDVLEIARLQQQAEESALATGEPVIVADTDLQIIKLWWQEKYGQAEFRVPTTQRNTVAAGDANDIRRSYRSYLLCYPDLAWQPDPLRENPWDRQRLFKLQMQQLDLIAADYRVIWGHGAMRNRLACDYVNLLISNPCSLSN